MFKFAIPAVAALGLITVAAQSRATQAEAEAPASPMGWHLSQEGPMAKLAYGVANSDQLALMMTCEPGQAQAVIYGDVHPASPRLTHVSAGPTPIDPLDGDLADEARLPLADPALARFASRGRLAVEGDGGHFELTATDEERSVIQSFFAYCGTGTV